jgi:guanylate kinase
MLVVSSPSGAGKTTLTRRLIRDHSQRLIFSVSYTTRRPRADERNGVDYHFVDDDTFDRMVREEQFAEWARVHDHRYGTSRATIEEAFRAGKDILFDIDYQGGRQLKARYPAEAVGVFILPPTLRILAQRLRKRATDDEAVIRRRLQKAMDELSHYHAYEYLVVNDDLEVAYQELLGIYRSAGCRWDRRSRYAEQLLQEAERGAFWSEIESK